MMMMMTNIHKMTMIMHHMEQARQQHTEEESDRVEDNCDGDGDDDDDEHTQDNYDYAPRG